MKRGFALIGVGIWVLIAIFLVYLMVAFIPNSNWGGVPFVISGIEGFNLSTIFDENTRGTLLKEEQHALSSIDELSFTFTPSRVSITVTDAQVMTVREYGNEGIESEYLFTSAESGNTLSITGGKGRVVSFFGLFNLPDRVEILLPRSYAGILNIKSVSGSIHVDGALNVKNLVAESTSGSLNFEEVTSQQNIHLSTTSGSVSADGLSASEEITLSSRSGSLRMNGKVSAPSVTASSNSGSVTVDELIADSYNLKSTSGRVTAEGVRGAGECSSTSGSVNVSLADMTGDTSLSTISGSIRVELDDEVSCGVDITTTSGSVHSDYLLVSADKVVGKHVTGQIGANPAGTLRMSSTSGSVRLSEE